MKQLFSHIGEQAEQIHDLWKKGNKRGQPYNCTILPEGNFQAAVQKKSKNGNPNRPQKSCWTEKKMLAKASRIFKTNYQKEGSCWERELWNSTNTLKYLAEFYCSLVWKEITQGQEKTHWKWEGITIPSTLTGLVMVSALQAWMEKFFVHGALRRSVPRVCHISRRDKLFPDWKQLWTCPDKA